jgi:tRNA(Ile)-lysidine synthase
MLFPGQRAGVAVSGGADSIFLLHALVELGYPAQVLHVNHHLRGKESEEDSDFVAALARSLGLPFAAYDAPLPPGSGNLEQAARKLRLACFRDAIAAGAADRVALGHTRSDQAETVLFRFLRGSGTAGLAGIRPVTSAGLIRPLIDVDREEVRAWLRDRGIAWRDDSTNESLEFARNRIRNLLLPQLAREWNPAITETLAQTAGWAFAEEAYWRDEIDRLATQHLLRGAPEDGILLRAEALEALPLAVARRLVRRAMESVKGDLRAIDFRHVEAVLELSGMSQGGRVQAPGLDICRSFDWIRVARPIVVRNYRLPAAVPGITEVPGTRFALSLEIVENAEIFATGDSVYNGVVGHLDWTRLSGRLELRNWQPGDRFQPAGASGEVRVKDLFQDARIPLWERGKWPVLTDGSRIVWARRFGPAVGYAAGVATGVVLRVQEVTTR